MKNLFTLFITAWLCLPGFCQSKYVPGDILITSVNCNTGGGGQWDEFTIISFKTFAAGDYVDFTDNGYEHTTAGLWGDLEGTFRLTRKSGASTVNAGTPLCIQTSGTTGTYKVYTCGVLDNNWVVSNLNGSVMFNINPTDCFWILYGGTWSNPAGNNNATYSGIGLYGYTPTSWNISSGYNSAAGSTIFSSLDCMNTALTMANSNTDKRAKYSGVLTSATQDVWISRITNGANWTTFNNNNSYYAYRDYSTTCINYPLTASSSGSSVLGTWTGAKNNNWFDCANWSGKQVPDTTINVIVPSTCVNNPKIDGSQPNAIRYQKRASCNNLILQSNTKPLEIKYIAGGNTGSLYATGNIELQANASDLPGGKLIADDATTGTADGTIALKGNWINNAGTAQFVKGESLVIFGGTASQSISATGNQPFYKLELKNTQGLTLQSSITVADNLKMVAGNINTSSNLIQIGTSAAEPGTITHTSGFVIGKMSRWFSGTNTGSASALFPLATSGYQNRFAEVEYTNAPTMSGKLTATFVESDPGDAGLPILQANSGGFNTDVFYTSPEGYWQIDNDPGTLTDGNYTLSLTGTGFGGIVSLTNITLIKRHTSVGPNWFTDGTHLTPRGNINSPTVSRSGMSNWSNFNIGRGLLSTPLPVELIYFTGNRNKNNVHLNWSTATEINSDYFAIERSTDGMNFEETGRITAANTSTTTLQYSFTDLNATDKTSYYRLRMVDLDGATEYSNIIAIEPGTLTASVKVFPNPAKDNLQLINNLGETGELQIVNIAGLVILSDRINDSEIKSLNISSLPEGIYFARINTGNNSEIIKWIKQ